MKTMETPDVIMGTDLPAIRVSARHSRYFEDAGSGRVFIPIGLNLCFPRFDPTPEEGLARYEGWLGALADNGGNFIRLWLGHPFFDVEPERAGEFCEDAAGRLDAVLEMARRRGIRVKLTLEHFRSLATRAEQEIFPGATRFAKPVYHRANGGFADDMEEFLRDARARRFYLRKLDFLAERYAGHPAIFGWELWNEMDSVVTPAWVEWTRAMLPELRRRFPGHLVMQSLGSFDSERACARYRDYTGIPGSDLHQVHRYLDPGAPLPECHGPMDTLCAGAVESLLDFTSGPTPVLLAECGAVEPRHTAPSRLYETDTEGVLLHDQLFAPFFAGASGPGQAWHWDFYVERHGLWRHFHHFARAVEGFDPIAECARPHAWRTPRFRIHALFGRHSSLLWLRDAASDWRSELVEGTPAGEIVGERLLLPVAMPPPPLRRAVAFDPWRETSAACVLDGRTVALPPFRRSLVLRLFHTR